MSSRDLDQVLDSKDVSTGLRGFRAQWCEMLFCSTVLLVMQKKQARLHPSTARAFSGSVVLSFFKPHNICK